MTTLDPQTAPTLQQGASNDWVAYLQGCLTALGHPTGSPDGDFGPRTRAAVVAFQQAAGLVADGVVGPRTWEAIVAAFQPPGGGTPGGGETPDEPTGHVLDPARAPMLREGDEGEWVHYLQELLERSGHTPGPIDGIFGPRTEAGVRSFQAANGCDVDGIVGPQTWTALVPVAAQHPTAPPYGTTPSRPGGGGGRGGGGGGTAVVTTDVHATYEGGEEVWFHFPTTNHGTAPVTVKVIEWSVTGGGFNVTDTHETGQEAAGGETVTTDVGIPGSPSLEPETITVRSVAVWTDGAGREHRTPPAVKSLTLHPDGTITEGPAPKTEPAEPKLPVEPKVTVVVGTDAEIDHENDMLGWHVNVHNGTDHPIYVSGTVYSAQSGPTTFNGTNQNGSPVDPGETVKYSDVVLMPPSAAEPYVVTLTAFVEFGEGGGELRSSSTGSLTFTMDGEGVVNGTAHGGGGEPEEPEEPEEPIPGEVPALQIDGEIWSSGNAVNGQAVVLNGADWAATDVTLSVELVGAARDAQTKQIANLPGGESALAMVSLALSEERSGPEHFVLLAYATESHGSYVSVQRNVTIYPDGTVEHG